MGSPEALITNQNFAFLAIGRHFICEVDVAGNHDGHYRGSLLEDCFSEFLRDGHGVLVNWADDYAVLWLK